MPAPSLRPWPRRAAGAAVAAAMLVGACAGGDDSERAAVATGTTEPAAGAGGAVDSNVSRPDLTRLMRADEGASRHESDGGGRAWLDGQEPARIHAGERGRWTFVYEAGPHGIAPGGMVLLQVSPFWGWSTPQVEDPTQAA